MDWRYFLVIGAFIGIMVWFWVRGKEDFRRGFEDGEKLRQSGEYKKIKK